MRLKDSMELKLAGGCFGIAAVFVIVIFIAWGVNLNKFTNCDFESPYRCEAIHGFGIIPLVSVFTVWYDTDND